MIDYLDMVREFHEEFGCDYATHPSDMTATQGVSRLRLIIEETAELAEGIDNHDKVAIADALADLLYVVFGTAVVCGIPMDKVFAQVHDSNMTKKGGHFEGGKYIKPDTYEPVDLSWLKQ